MDGYYSCLVLIVLLTKLREFHLTVTMAITKLHASVIPI